MLFRSWRELQAGWTSWNLLKSNGVNRHGLTGIMPAPEQPCWPASSHGRLSFRPVLVTAAHAQSSLPSPVSVGMKLLQWIPFLMFETLNSCRRKLVCAKIMPNVGKNLPWCALLPNFKKNQQRKFVSSQIRFVHFPHLRGQLWGVTTSQYHSFLSIFWHVWLRRWGTIAYR